MTVDPKTLSRRNFLGLAAGTAATVALAGCGSSGPSDKGSSGGGGSAAAGAATYWFLTGPPGEQIRQASVDRFNQANPDAKITATTFQNDAYKTKIKTAIGAGQAPTIIWGWGGGGLRSYVQANQVEDLTSWFAENAAVKDRLFPSSFGAATIDGKIYAMPAETVQPIVLYWNKKALRQGRRRAAPVLGRHHEPGAEVQRRRRRPHLPRRAVALDEHDVAGVPLRPHRRPEVFQAVFDGEKDAWSNPASIEGLTKAQELIKANGFVKGFSSITADSNADQALLYTGKAAMMLHGTWTYGNMKQAGGDFVSGGNLGYMNFPRSRAARATRPTPVGNPGQYYSISSKATPRQKETAKKFFSTAVLSDAEVKEWIDNGAIRSSRAPTASSAPPRTPTSSSSSTASPATPRSSPSPGTRPSAPPPPRSCSTTSPSSSSCRSPRSSSPPT
jgi:raffinose/stachyose/melibiose transport system substrate-binding protein